jgi:TetR/AcrR family transcriptional repressor of nem operon
MAEPESTTDTRQRILDAALHLFHRDAYQAVGINAICNEAGVVKGSFYHFFPSKQALLAAVVETLAVERRKTWQQARSNAPSNREAIQEFFRLWLETSEQQQKQHGQALGCCLGVLSSELCCNDPAAQALFQANFAEWQKELKQGIRDGIADASIAPSVDAGHSADALLALLQGLSTLARTGLPSHRMHEATQLALKRLLPMAASRGT